MKFIACISLQNSMYIMRKVNKKKLIPDYKLEK